MSHMRILQLYLVPLAQRHVSVVLLVGDVGDGLVHGSVKLVGYFGFGKGNVMVVMCLVLEIHEELGLLGGHCI